MKPDATAMMLLVVGVVAMLMSFVVPLVLTPQGAWTDAQAETFNESRAQLHNLRHSRSHAHGAEISHNHNELPSNAHQLAALETTVAKQQRQLDAAINRAVWPSWILRAFSVLCLVVGLTMLLRERSSS